MLFSTGGAAVKGIGFTGWQVASLRSGIAALALFIAVPTTRRRWDWRSMSVGLAYAITCILFVLATKETTSANAIFLQSAAPLYLLILAPLLLHEAVTSADLICIVVIAMGLALVMTGSPRPTSISPHPMRGNIYATISGVSLAFTTVGLRWLGAMEDGEARKGAVLVTGNIASFLICLPFAWSFARHGAKDWMLITYLGTIQIALAYFLVTKGLRSVPAVEASLVMLVEPALNPIWVWLIHGEAPGAIALLGGALILGASVMRAVVGKRQAEPIPEPVMQ
jgi:drug/metabolite transporter (DMT)-like permease